MTFEVRPAVSITLSSGPGAPTVAEPYRIADGIRWVG